MSQGFLRISRDIVDWGWYKDSNTFRLFFHLLLKANFQDSEYKGIVVKRGQYVTSRSELAYQLGMSEQNVRTSLTHLKVTNEITTESTSKLTIITICKYDSWQGCASETNQQTNQQPNHELTSNQPAIEEESNNDNNIIKEKEDTNVSPKKKPSEELFEECWIAYNRKGSKKKSKEQWIKLTIKESELVLTHIKAYVGSRERQYQKDFERYLRDKTFNDVVTKGNSVVYDPSVGANTSYTPPTDGSIKWNEPRKCYIYIGMYFGYIPDGYTDDNRPNGARIMLGNKGVFMNWNEETKQWEEE